MMKFIRHSGSKLAYNAIQDNANQNTTKVQSRNLKRKKRIRYTKSQNINHLFKQLCCMIIIRTNLSP